MKYLLLALSAFTCQAFAGAKVNYLNVEGDLISFTTEETKTAASPACVAAETANLWSVSLSSQNGRTLYSLLATSLAGNLDVTVASAQDCADVDGIERAKSISITPATVTETSPASASGASNGAYLYTGDGLTKLGPIISVANSYIYYASANNPRKLEYYKPVVQSRTLEFAQSDCQGAAYERSANFVYYHESYNGGQYMKSDDTAVSVRKVSYLDNGVCTNYSSPYNQNLYPVDTSYVDPLCGQHACLLMKD